MKNLFLFTCVTLVSVGCATNTNKTKAENLTNDQIAAYNARVEESKRIICRNEKPLGSNISERKCYTVAQLKERQDRDKQMLRNDQSRQPGRNSG